MATDNNNALRDADVRQITELMRALERSGFDTLQIETGDLKLTLSKGEIGTLSAPTPTPKADPVSVTTPAAVPAAGTAKAPAPAQAPTAAAMPEEGLAAIRSPIMGQFFRAPDPASPPFVDVGAEIDLNTTVGLIEVMKVFNAIPAGVKGKVVEICAKDSETVQMGQILFKVRPA